MRPAGLPGGGASRSAARREKTAARPSIAVPGLRRRGEAVLEARRTSDDLGRGGENGLGDDPLDSLLGLGHAGLDRVLDLGRDEVDLRLQRLELPGHVATGGGRLAADLVAALPQLALDARAAALELALEPVAAGGAATLELLELALHRVGVAVGLAQVVVALDDSIAAREGSADVGQGRTLDQVLDLIGLRGRLALGGRRRALGGPLRATGGAAGLGTRGFLGAVLGAGTGGTLRSGAALRRGGLAPGALGGGHEVRSPSGSASYYI